MATNVVMPQMGESIAEGTIVRWIKKVGDSVDRDEPLFEISTDKVDAEIPSPRRASSPRSRSRKGRPFPSTASSRSSARLEKRPARAAAEPDAGVGAADSLPAAAVGQTETRTIEQARRRTNACQPAEARPSAAAAPAGRAAYALERGTAPAEIVAARAPDRARNTTSTSSRSRAPASADA